VYNNIITVKPRGHKMDIQVVGRNSPTKTVIEAASIFLAKELKLDKSKYTLLISTQRGLSKDEGMKGYVTRIGPKCLHMNLDSGIGVERLITTLAHEMVHVKQYAKGQIKSSKSCKTNYWMGKNIRKEYFEQPWEIEAYSKERVLANKIFHMIGKYYAMD